MTITEKVAYLKGLSEGLQLDETQKEGKLIKAIIDVLEDVAFSVADLEDGMTELCDQVDMIDEDLGSLEEDFYDFDDDCCGDDCDCDDCCGGELEDYMGDLYDVECPACGETICIDDDTLNDGSINCPSCGELLEFEVEEDEE